jgi:flagellar M-ring protein FliF
MNEKLTLYRNKIISFWRERSGVQKGIMIASIVSLIVLIVVVTMMTSKNNLVPLYSNLSLQETGQIQETLKTKGIQYEVANNGTTIKVPEANVDSLMVELAAEGIPDSGNIDYSFFGQNSGWGVTDKEFNVLKVEAMQTELANLIREIDGVENAKVMLNIPEESIWVNEQTAATSASIVLNQKAGYRFDQSQINALYHLVSKSVPNLPVENIVIMNQMFEPFAVTTEESTGVTETFSTQYEIKKEIEKDIQNQVQQMLSMMIGQDKVVASVTADVDFTKVKTTEERYEPVDRENMTGITRSVERITETFTGNGLFAGGINGTGETDIPTMQEIDGAGGDYERLEERINNEVDKIYREIDSSPYVIKDLGIQVVVDPTTGTSTNESGIAEPILLGDAEQAELTAEIEQMLSTIIRTSVPAGENVNVAEKISITMQPFNGRIDFNSPTPSTPTWVYAAGAALALIAGVIILILMRRRRSVESEKADVFTEEEVSAIPDVNETKSTESGQRRKQLEKMAKEKPEEFAKLLRTWIADE